MHASSWSPLVLILAVSAMGGSAPDTLDLDMALASARADHPAVLSAQEDLEVARARKSAARGAMLPTATLTSDWSRTAPNAGDEGRFNPASRSTGDAIWRNSLGLRWTVFDGLRSWNGLRGLEEREQAKHISVEAVRDEVEEQVVRLWSELWLADRRLAVLRETMETSRIRRDIANRRAEIGALSGLEARQATLDLMSDSLASFRAEHARNEASRQLELALGRSPEGRLRAVESWLVPGPDSSARLVTSPRLEALRHEEVAAAADRRMASGAWWPEFSLYADYVHLGFLDDEPPPGTAWHQGMIYGAKASWTVFEGGRTAARQRETSAWERRLASQRRSLERELQAQRMAAEESVRAARKGWDLSRAIEEQAEGLWKASMARYQAGDLSGLDLRRAQDALTRMRLQASTAKVELLRLQMDLARLPRGGLVGK